MNEYDVNEYISLIDDGYTDEQAIYALNVSTSD